MQDKLAISKFLSEVLHDWQEKAREFRRIVERDEAWFFRLLLRTITPKLCAVQIG
jgi:hypothetical protein